MPRTRKIAELEAELETLQLEKGKYLDKSRSRARAISVQLNKLIAEDKAKAKIDAMSDEDRVAMAAALAGGDN